MFNVDLLIYAVHTAFWAAFGVTRAIVSRGDRAAGAGAADSGPATSETYQAPGSRALVAFHAVAFGAIYLGLGRAIALGRVPIWFPASVSPARP